MKIITIIAPILLFLALPVLAERPEWISNSNLACPKSHLCAIGEGVSYNSATASGRNALALIFESKIKSSLNAQETAAASEVQINISEEINQSTEAILNGVIILKSYEDKTSYYALAGLDKMIASKQLKEKIDEIDSEMKLLASEKNRINGEKLLKWHLKRAPLLSHYQVLTGNSIAPVISYSEIAKMRNLKAKGPALYISFSGDADQFFEKRIAELMTSLGHEIADKNEGQIRHLKGSIKRKQEYLNIEGFVRYSFVFELSAWESNKSLGQITITTTKTARDELQAASYARTEINRLLEDKILELNLK